MVNKLLVVGASTIVEQLFKIGLMDSPIEVRVTASSREAEDLIISDSPDIVFVDPSLKGGNPYDLVRSIKGEYKKTVVMLKGTAASWDESEFENSGADDILKKPFEPDALMNIINKFGGASPTAKSKASSSKNEKQVDIKKIKPKRVGTKPASSLTDSSGMTPYQTSSKKSAISLLKKAELENAKKFIRTNLVAKGKGSGQKQSKAFTTGPVEDDSTDLPNEALEARVDTIVKDVVERIVWEVVPKLAETMIQNELKRLLAEK